MKKDAFKAVAMVPQNPKYEAATRRLDATLPTTPALYPRNNDMRNDFERDYTRILHCTAFRRLKHKTQVFYAPHNDHVCTRMEHSLHVESVAQTICEQLGLNSSLCRAIALGHDLGHAPFGHCGEECLDSLARLPVASSRQKSVADDGDSKKFWHEKNSLFFADFIELLPNPNGGSQNLDLTYATRDGIICHCGEVINNDGLLPRNDVIDLYSIKKAGSVAPFSFEGCVVRISDLIAYIGRDIEDAKVYSILDDAALQKNSIGNTTVLINDLIVDLCENSSPEAGLQFSAGTFKKLQSIRQFSLDNIYNNWRMLQFKKYADLVIKTLYSALTKKYRNGGLSYCTVLSQDFGKWQQWYNKVRPRFEHDVSDDESFAKCAIEYISGMSDTFAIKVFNEIISF